jgi:hypothetical protein
MSWASAILEDNLSIEAVAVGWVEVVAETPQKVFVALGFALPYPCYPVSTLLSFRLLAVISTARRNLEHWYMYKGLRFLALLGMTGNVD